MPAVPVAYGLFGYGTAAMTYGLYLLTGFPPASGGEEARRVRAALAANGFCFGGIAQLLTSILLFVFTGDALSATTFGIFGVLWIAIWLNDYFNLDPRPLVYLDIAIVIWTILSGAWSLALGHPVLAALLWSITVLCILLCLVHGRGSAAKPAGFMAVETAVLAYYISAAVIFQVALRFPLPF